MAIEFSKINRNSNWKEVFETIDNNFELLKSYLKNIGNRVKVEMFSATEGQKSFTLDSKYNTKRNCLAVYRGGVRQWLGEGFKETSDNRFEVFEPCFEGEQIVAVYNNYYILSDFNLKGEE